MWFIFIAISIFSGYNQERFVSFKVIVDIFNLLNFIAIKRMPWISLNGHKFKNNDHNFKNNPTLFVLLLDS